MSAQESGVGCPQDFSLSWFSVGEVGQMERSTPQFSVHRAVWEVEALLGGKEARCMERLKKPFCYFCSALSVLLNLSCCFHFPRDIRECWCT